MFWATLCPLTAPTTAASSKSYNRPLLRPLMDIYCTTHLWVLPAQGLPQNHDCFGVCNWGMFQKHVAGMFRRTQLLFKGVIGGGMFRGMYCAIYHMGDCQNYGPFLDASIRHLNT